MLSISMCFLVIVLTSGSLFASGIQRSSTVLVLGKDISGKIFIRDRNDELVVELARPLGKMIELGLEEGEYKIVNVMEQDVYELNISH